MESKDGRESQTAQEARDPHHRAYGEAAREAVSSTHCLPGEDLDSTNPEDAKLWISVYQELLGFKDHLLSTTETQVEAMSGPARHEVENTDLVILRAEAERFRTRLSYWTSRRAELSRSKPIS